MAQRIRSGVVPFVLAVALLSLAPLAEAVDGVVLIDQNRALAGYVTPGDLPGFPVTISRPGSYRLSGNLDIADPDASAIEITSNNVTVDLNGFVIQGPLDQCAGSLVPVWCQNQLRGVGIEAHFPGSSDVHVRPQNVTVLNGTVRAMGDFGVLLGLRTKVARLSVVDNRGVGILIFAGLILDNVVMGNSDGSVAKQIQIAGGITVMANNVCAVFLPCF